MPVLSACLTSWLVKMLYNLLLHSSAKSSLPSLHSTDDGSLGHFLVAYWWKLEIS